MAKLKTRVIGYAVKKIVGSKGEFGRLDNWGVVRLQKNIFPSGLETIITDRIVISRHNSKEAAEKTLAKVQK